MKPTAARLIFLAGLTGTAQAFPRTCTNYTIPITITSNNLAFGLPTFHSNFDVANFVDTISSRNTTTAASVVSPARRNVTATYTISATFCQPALIPQNNRTKRTVLIATHGLNFDRSYWSPPALNKTTYSFVDWAVSCGYSVLYYDRLGVGQSERVSGYLAQLANQVAILAELASLVRAGRYVGDLGMPGAVVLVGHSFGSAVSLNTVAENPKLVDGLVLTGFSLNSTYTNLVGFIEAVGLRIAAVQDSERWGGLDSVG
jgi:pimeloyl-ACP methyl ester carboxylesterase